MLDYIRDLFKENDKRTHMWAGATIILIIFALLTRYTWPLWLLPFVLVSPIVWEYISHKGAPFTREEYRDIVATWLGMSFGAVASILFEFY